jgi:Tol biopolymer transport system component
MSFIGEVRRRKVFQVAAVYAVVAWLLVQVVTAIEAPLSLPDWVDTLVIVLLAVGFPIALVLGWIFDVTPEGIRATDGSSERQQLAHPASHGPGRTFGYVSQWLVLLAVGFLVFDQYVLDDARSGSAADAAALPAANPAVQQVSRYAITPPPAYLIPNGGGYEVEIAPDGSRVVMLVQDPVSGLHSLFVRELDNLEPRLIADGSLLGAEAGPIPFFSPDGQSIGFFTPDLGILQVSVNGGTPRTLVPPYANQFGGATWGSDGNIIYSDIVALYLIADNGTGEPEQLTPEPESGDSAAYIAPSYLPGERAVLMGMFAADGDSIAVLDLQTREIRTLVSGGAENPRYLRSGHIVYGLNGSLMAVPFDLDELALSGDPILVQDGIRDFGSGGAADFAVSASGTLTFVPDSGIDGATMNSVNWVDRSGAIVAPALTEPVEAPVSLRLSPDGRHLLLNARRNSLSRDLLVYDLSGRPPVPLVVGSLNITPIWNSDGTQIAFFGRDRQRRVGLFRMRADGSQLLPELVSDELPIGRPLSWSLSNELIVRRDMDDTRWDLYTLAPDGSNAYEPLLVTASNEDEAELSPSNRWLAFVSDRSGQKEVWVMPYPDGVPVRVSGNGGVEPVWAADESELFFLQGDTLMAVPVEAGDEFAFGTAQPLFSGGFWHSDSDGAVSYDVAADGRFIMIGPEDTAEHNGNVDHIVVVENWISELEMLTRQ